MHYPNTATLVLQFLSELSKFQNTEAEVVPSHKDTDTRYLSSSRKRQSGLCLSHCLRQLTAIDPFLLRQELMLRSMRLTVKGRRINREAGEEKNRISRLENTSGRVCCRES